MFTKLNLRESQFGLTCIEPLSEQCDFDRRKEVSHLFHKQGLAQSELLSLPD